MNFYVENESTIEFDFDIHKVLSQVAEDILDSEACPYEAEVNLLVTDKSTIQEINRDNRNIDRVTDVLSFPNCEYDSPGDFSIIDEDSNDLFNPETGELVLGDIIICAEKVLEQAEEYGHSILREFAFLVAHSMYHLCGYDHMTDEDAVLMEGKQRETLNRLGITRE